jgi:hypothetical protein
VRKIIRLREPTSKKELERFLGLVQWISTFIPRLAKLSEPLHKLRRKAEIFHWDQEQRSAFESIKRAVRDCLWLKHPKCIRQGNRSYIRTTYR